MTTVTGFTAARMLEIENGTVVDGAVVGDNLVLEKRDGTTINAGSVRGPMGPGGSGYVICTSTTRPTVDPGDAGMAIYETDTGLTRMWNGTRWRLMERIVATSTTRPVLDASDEGARLYETDTNREYVWDSAAWKLVPRYEDIPRGLLGTKVLSGGAGANLTWTDISGGGLAVNVGNNRRIVVMAEVGFLAAGIDGKSVSIRAERAAGQGLGESFERMHVDYCTHTLLTEHQVVAASTYVYTIMAKTEHTSIVPLNVNWQHLMFVYDMGPITPANSANVPS